MGNFSWITKSGQQITDGSKVWMAFKFDNKTVVVDEDDYACNGVFGGLDYYRILYQMNHNKIVNFPYIQGWNQQREMGLDLQYKPQRFEIEGKLEYPQLFLHSPSIKEIENINWNVQCEDDPNQGSDYICEDEYFLDY